MNCGCRKVYLHTWKFVLDGASCWWEECFAIITQKSRVRSVLVLHYNSGEHTNKKRLRGSTQSCLEKVHYVHNTTRNFWRLCCPLAPSGTDWCRELKFRGKKIHWVTPLAAEMLIMLIKSMILLFQSIELLLQIKEIQKH